MALHQPPGLVQVSAHWQPAALPGFGRSIRSASLLHPLPLLPALPARGPFSGGKVMHAHLCGRLPRNTLVVAYDPEVPAGMISGDVGTWFRCVWPATRCSTLNMHLEVCCAQITTH